MQKLLIEAARQALKVFARPTPQVVSKGMQVVIKTAAKVLR